MKKLLNHVLPIFALCALAACTDSDDATSSNTPGLAPDGGKELIALSQEGSGMTRASLTRAGGFTTDTKIVMRIKAENASTSPTATRYSQAIATAGAEISGDALNTDIHKTQFGLDNPHSHVTYNTGNQRYWDDAFGRSSYLTVYAVAVPNVNSTAPTRTDGQALISDDILNQENPTKINEDTNPNWYTIATTEDTKIKWSVSTKQTSGDGGTMKAEDLIFSNNIREGVTGDNMKGRYHQEPSGSSWTSSMQLGRMSWQAQSNGSTVGKFDQGHLVFQHALTKLEIRINEGAGFNSESESDFTWTHKPTDCAQTITLSGFNTSGELDLSKPIDDANLWTGQTPTSITQLDETVTGTSTKKRTLIGYVVPGTTLDGNSANLIEFEIDDAKYYVSGEQIATAIQTFSNNTSHAAAVKTLPGKHYIINLTVGKKMIDNITAAVLDWEEVNSTEITAENTYCDFTFEDRGGKVTTDLFNIYRKEITIEDFINSGTDQNHEWITGFATTAATKEWKSEPSSGHWETGWFWKDNKTYYHFRAAGLNASGAVRINTDGTNGDNFTISHGPVDASGDYKDYLWGAPFVDVEDSYKFNYDVTNGFAYKDGSTTEFQISQAIGATKDQIKMLLFHMTSQISVNLKTTTGDDKVVLHKAADDTNLSNPVAEQVTTVKIVNFLPTGKVYLGNGRVEANGDRNAAGVAMTTGTPDDSASPNIYTGFTYGMVPQDLKGDWGTVGLEITTPDNNTYYVRDLSTITGTVTETNIKIPYSGTAGNYVIDRWYPSFKYTYNITLKKKGILDITAAVLPWEVVEGDNINIDLEN